ncbi:MAG: nucleotide exchange factor GrpE, partial [Bacteroidota bacterium]|nr:nucleotide exchange factor GrpE [Bacteroidota bacterium]
MSKKNKAPKNKKVKSEKDIKTDDEIQNEQIETEKKSEKKEQEEEIVSENNESTDKDDVIIEEKKDDSEEEKKDDTIEDYQIKLTEMNDKYMRLAAEYDNYRRRTLKEKMDLIKNGGTDILKSILPVIDNFERAMKSYEESSDIEAVKDGIELI